MLDRALVGAGSVFLNTDFSRYILAISTVTLIGLYNIVKLRTDEYVAAAREMFTPENNVAERYYLYRDEFNQSRSVVSRGAVPVFEPSRLRLCAATICAASSMCRRPL